MLNTLFKLIINTPKAFLNNPEFKKEFNNVFTEFEKAAHEAEKIILMITFKFKKIILQNYHLQLIYMILRKTKI